MGRTVGATVIFAMVLAILVATAVAQPAPAEAHEGRGGHGGDRQHEARNDDRGPGKGDHGRGGRGDRGGGRGDRDGGRGDRDGRDERGGGRQQAGRTSDEEQFRTSSTRDDDRDRERRGRDDRDRRDRDGRRGEDRGRDRDDGRDRTGDDERGRDRDRESRDRRDRDDERGRRGGDDQVLATGLDRGGRPPSGTGQGPSSPEPEAPARTSADSSPDPSGSIDGADEVTSAPGDVGGEAGAAATSIQQQAPRLMGAGGFLEGDLGWLGRLGTPGPSLDGPTGPVPSTVGGLPVLLALLGAFLALQRGIGQGLGHVPMAESTEMQVPHERP